MDSNQICCATDIILGHARFGVLALIFKLKGELNFSICGGSPPSSDFNSHILWN